jgi:tight adherence protein B
MEMALIVGTFLSVLLVTFLLVIVSTRQSEDQKIVSQRMAMLRQSLRTAEGITPGAAQLLKVQKENRFSWLDELLRRFQFARALEVRIHQANSSASVSGLILGSLGLLIAGFSVTWLFMRVILIDVAAGAALSMLPYGVLSLKRRKRVNAFNAALPEAIDMLARALRAGHSVVGALEMLAENAQEPLSTEFEEVFKQLNLGLPIRDALLQLLERVPSSDLRVLVTAIMVQKDTGGNLVEILDRTVFVIRERLRIQGEIQVQTAQGRLTGWILTALPAVMMALLNLVNPGYSSILFHEPVGRKLLYISLGMLATGGWVIRHLVNGIEV